LAIGNDTAWLNGKVFFGYYKCKATKPTFVKITEVVSDGKTSRAYSESFCVLGIPTLGYFSNNEWAEILTLTRGDVCEPEVDNTCCNE
jgi:hypothetical protein